MMIGANHLGVLSVALNVRRGDVNTPARIGSGLTSVDIELIGSCQVEGTHKSIPFVRIDNVGRNYSGK